MGVTKSNKNNIKSPLGNSLALFVDYNDNQLKLKDIRGNVQGITDYVTGIPSGVLQLENGVPLDSTYRAVQDQNGNNSPLYMSLNGVTAIGTGGIMTNTVFGAESFLYNGNGYENAIFGWSNAYSLDGEPTSPLRYTGYGNVAVGWFNYVVQNAIRNVFIGSGVAGLTEFTPISCVDNVIIGNGAGGYIQGIIENNVFLGSAAGETAESTNSIAIGGLSGITNGISNNNIALGPYNINQINANNTISIGYNNLYSNYNLDFSYNDIVIGTAAMNNYYDPDGNVTQDNIIIKTIGQEIVANYTPKFAEKSVNICRVGDNMFAVQIGGQMTGVSRRNLNYIDFTSTFIGNVYAETLSNPSPILDRRLTVVNPAGIVNVTRAIDCTFIGTAGGGLTNSGSNPNNTFIGNSNFVTKSNFTGSDGYNVSNSTICGNNTGRVNQFNVNTVTNLTILGNGYRTNIVNNSNNTLVGALNISSGGLSTKSNCTSIGYNALRVMNTGVGLSTAIGSGALAIETTGVNNTAIGATTVSGPISQTHTLVGQGITNSVINNVGVTIIGQGITNSSAGTGSLILGKSAANTAAARAVFGSSSVNAGAIAVESLVSNTTWTVIINGTQYKMLLRA